MSIKGGRANSGTMNSFSGPMYGMDMKAEMESAAWEQRGEAAAEAQMMAAALGGTSSHDHMRADGDSFVDIASMKSAADASKRFAMAFNGAPRGIGGTAARPITPPQHSLDQISLETWENAASNTVECQSSEVRGVGEGAEGGGAAPNVSQFLSNAPQTVKLMAEDPGEAVKSAARFASAFKRASSKAYQETIAQGAVAQENIAVTRLSMI